ncbi:MAG: AAA family ATPase [Myxococcota bacterium]
MSAISLQSPCIINPQGPMPRGVSDFTKLRGEGYVFVDKSPFIKEILDSGDAVTLITRPRRFGKTINLNMLRCFLHWPPDHQPDLFDGLTISQAGERYHQERGKRPVLFVTFKDVKAGKWDDAWIKLRGLLANTAEVAARETPVNRLTYDQRDVLEKVIHKQAEPAECQSILAILTELLTLKHDGMTPWVLIDEYDTPLHAAYQHNYYSGMRDVIRGLLGQCLKDNNDPSQPQTFLHKAVITGILRVAKEDIFSDLNNLGVYGVTEDRFASSFGFTASEVKELLAARGLSDRFDAVRDWYDGYRFGEGAPATIYNPWSVISYLGNSTQTPRPYWVNTSGDALLYSMVEKSNDPQDRANVETLLLGGTVEKEVPEGVALRDLPTLSDALWSILLTGGYLTAEHTEGGTLGTKAVLCVPNREVRIAYGRLALRWFGREGPDPLPKVLFSLEHGDVAGFAQALRTFAQASLSYFDFAASQPERVYHALMVGLAAGLTGRYHIRSNRESGKGRPDLLLIPHDPRKPGIVMEFKVIDSEGELEQATDKALRQIKGKNYHAELFAQGVNTVIALGLAFAGKDVAVEHQTLTAADITPR